MLTSSSMATRGWENASFQGSIDSGDTHCFACPPARRVSGSSRMPMMPFRKHSADAAYGA